jgi:hypothetical protein
MKSLETDRFKRNMLRSIEEGFRSLERVSIPPTDLKARKLLREYMVVLEECQSVMRRAFTPRDMVIAGEKLRRSRNLPPREARLRTASGLVS